MQQTPLRQARRKRDRVTIRQVAKLPNLSPTAVSMARANHPQISEETRMRVQQICRELGYEGKRRSAPSGRVGFVLLGDRIEKNVNAALLQAITSSTTAANLRLEITCIPDVDDMSTVIDRTVDLARELDGVLVMGRVYGDLLAALGKADVPVVVVGHASIEPGRFPITARVTVVAADDAGEAQFATSRLIACGHQRIAFVSDIVFAGLQHAKWLSGYGAAHALAQMPMSPDLIQIAGTAEGDMSNVADAIVAMPESKRPTAYLIPDVRQAWVFIHAMRKRGIEIARDSVIMNDNPSFVQQFQMQDWPMMRCDFHRFATLSVWHLQALCARQSPCMTDVLVPFTGINLPEPAKK